MKKGLLIIIVVAGVLLILAGGIFLTFNKKQPQSSREPQNNEVITEVALEDRPFVTLAPREDGKELTLEVSNIGNSSTIEYELVYLSQGLSRGVVGSIEYNGETSVSRKILLGSCSKNVCKYDEGVKEGTLTLRLRRQRGVQKYTTDFRLQKGGKELSTADGNFKLTADLSPREFYIVMMTIGLPEKIAGKVISGPFGVFTSGSNKINNGKVELATTRERAAAGMYLWNGQSWLSIPGTSDSLGVFVLVPAQ